MGSWEGDIPFRKSGRGVTLEVRVKPRSSRLAIEGVSGGVLRVRLTAPPLDGAANEQLLELLSEELGVKKSGMTIIRGRTSRNKVVEVEGLSGPLRIRR